MTWLPFDRYAPSPRRAAALAAATITLGAGVALLATSGPRTHRARPAKPAPRAIGASFPHTSAGAVAAATEWCQNTTPALVNGTWEHVASALATPAFRLRVERGEPASQMVHSRLATPYTVRLWPLGYAVERYSPASARVHVWQLFVFEEAGPVRLATYQSTTVALQWVDGTWKVALAPQGPDLTPPGGNASTDQVITWINAVGQFRSYAYAP